MSSLTYDQVLELLPAYVLGALDPEEMLAVDTYLTHNRALFDRLRQAELAAGQMAHTAPDAPLPATAKNKLMARVQADLSATGLADPEIKPVPAPAAPAPLTPQKPALVTPHPEDRWAGFRRAIGSTKLWTITAACMLAALVGISLYLNQVRSQLGTLQTKVNQLQTANTQLQETNESLQQQLITNQQQFDQASIRLDALQSQTAELQTANSQLQQQVQSNQELLTFIGSGKLRQTVSLPGTEEAPAASGAFYLTNDNQIGLVLRGLKPLPSNQTYQLWLIPADGSPAPAGLLSIQTENPAWLKLPAPADAPADFTAVGISVEPAGGSPAPTGPIVLLGNVS
jgi:anti-sigma-K factor RskA